MAGVVFGLVDDRGKFWISAACGIAGVFVTFIMIPDITTLDLKEGDKRWLAIVSVSACCVFRDMAACSRVGRPLLLELRLAACCSNSLDVVQRYWRPPFRAALPCTFSSQYLSPCTITRPPPLPTLESAQAQTSFIPLSCHSGQHGCL